jgi:cytochrome c oxidase subunit 2
LPRQRREHIPVEITYMAVPLVIVAALFGLTFVSTEAIDDVDDDPDLTVEVIGFQWQWQFDYPASGVSVLGTETERPELVLPAGTRVQFDLRSVDVIHSFWIPGFRFKRDIFPGQTQTFQVDVGDTTGDFPDTGVCAEFCGLDHWRMRFDVRVVTPEEFAAWEQEQLEER